MLGHLLRRRHSSPRIVELFWDGVMPAGLQYRMHIRFFFVAQTSWRDGDKDEDLQGGICNFELSWPSLLPQQDAGSLNELLTWFNQCESVDSRRSTCLRLVRNLESNTCPKRGNPDDAEAYRDNQAKLALRQSRRDSKLCLLVLVKWSGSQAKLVMKRQDK